MSLLEEQARRALAVEQAQPWLAIERAGSVLAALPDHREMLELVRRCGGVVVACAFVIELAFLGGRKRLDGHEVFALLRYDRP